MIDDPEAWPADEADVMDDIREGLLEETAGNTISLAEADRQIRLALGFPPVENDFNR